MIFLLLFSRLNSYFSFSIYQHWLTFVCVFPAEFTTPRAILTGHDCEVTCASVCAELGLVISGCKGVFVFDQHVSSNNKSWALLTLLIMFFAQRVLVWSIPWMGTCCGPWRARSAACGLASSSPPPRETAWSTTTRDSSASSVSTANCWDTWRWRTASRWGNVSTHVKVHMCVCYTSAQKSRLTD